MADVILVEDTISDSALAYIAIALRRPGTLVAEARSLEHAAELVRRNRGTSPVVILGWRALQQGVQGFIRTVGAGAAVVGIAKHVGEECRGRALRAGVGAVYERPLEWREYASLMARVLEFWTPSREPLHG